MRRALQHAPRRAAPGAGRQAHRARLDRRRARCSLIALGGRRCSVQRERGPARRTRWRLIDVVIGVRRADPAVVAAPVPVAVALLTIGARRDLGDRRRRRADRAVQHRAARVAAGADRRPPRSAWSGGVVYSLVYPDRRSAVSVEVAFAVLITSSWSRGACSPARSATCCAPRTSAHSDWRPSSARTSSRRARPSGGGSRARCTTCSRTGSRCWRVHAGALEFRPDASPEEIAEAAGVIRATAHEALRDLR